MNECACVCARLHTYMHRYLQWHANLLTRVGSTYPFDISWQPSKFTLMLSSFHFYFSSQFLGEWQSCAVLGNRHRKY